MIIIAIFQNPDFTNEITVDLDTFFYYFVRPKREQPPEEKQGITLDLIRARIDLMTVYTPELAPAAIYSILYRRSSKDHAHVKLKFRTPVSVLDGFMIRAWLLDDQTRLSLDLARYFKTRDLHEMNRCFDEKAAMSQIFEAGPWIDLFTDRDQYSGEAKKDYQDYLERWKAYCKIHHIDIAEQTELGFC